MSSGRFVPGCEHRQMITAGEQTAKPGEWAAELATGLLLPVYKHALEYIDDRGWFNNTFDSPDDLEGEVQRVLDLRYEFGDVDDWPEFPFPEGWKPYYLERRRRQRRRAFTAELLTKIVANEKKYRTDAITYLQETAQGSRSAEQTVCLMWNKDGECRKAATGGSSKDVSKVRTKCGVSPKKETLCAEELFLTKYEPWSHWYL